MPKKRHCIQNIKNGLIKHLRLSKKETLGILNLPIEC